jgi:FkbM family methyltransferase
MIGEVGIHGRTFQVVEAEADFYKWVKQGRYAPDFDAILHNLRPSHTFLDLGAWVGSHSLLASTVAARTIAVEPDPVAFELLVQNVALNGNKVEPICFAVTNRNGMITLGSGWLGASTTRVNRDAGGGIGPWVEGHIFDVACRTLRELVRSLDIQDPIFIKMDVEGSEEQILEDFEFFEEHVPTLFLESHPFWWRDETATYELIHRLCSLYKVPASNNRRHIFRGR